jgi:GH35 family endo-1,4-beta-xylanase
MTLSPAPPVPGSISGLVTRLRNLGVDVALTEVDVPLGPARPEQAQVDIYRQLTTECLVAGCSEITVWGAGDGFTFLDTPLQRRDNPFLSAFFSLPSKPLLLDTNLQPKAAYAAVVETIQSTPPPPSP